MVFLLCCAALLFSVLRFSIFSRPSRFFFLSFCIVAATVAWERRLIFTSSTHSGAPKYLEYVRSTVVQKREAARAGAAREENPGKQNWYLQEREKPTEHEFVTESVVGNPNLVYEGELIPSFEPNGIKVYSINVCSFSLGPLTNVVDAGRVGGDEVCGGGEIRMEVFGGRKR